jgi:Na+/proline symporter
VHVWGLHVVDLAVLLFFLVVILGIGFKASHGVKKESDFYLGGRRLGRALQFFLNFGNATDSTGAVQTSRMVYRQGASGVWLGLQTLFITPFFWFTQPWYRRARVITMADLFVDRFNSKSVASAYAGFNILIALITLGTGNIAAYKVAAAMMVKDHSAYTEADRQHVANYTEFQSLAAKSAGTLSPAEKKRLGYLSDLNALGEISPDVPVFRKPPFLIGYSLIVAIYIMLGGLKAAAITDAVQGMLVLAMSVLLIPLGLYEIGGFKQLHLRVPSDAFSIFGDVAVSEYAWYTVIAITFTSLVQILGLMHNMSAAGSARDEDTARFGMISGGFTKRFVLIMWMFCGLLALAMFAGKLTDADAAWGKLSTALLTWPGLMGIMLSGMLLGHMPSVGLTSVAVSGLATRNLYEPVVRGQSERHYLRFGQFAIVAVLALGVVIAMYFRDVEQAWTTMITFNTYFGAVVVLIFLWRRLTPAAIHIGLAVWVILLGVMPWFVPVSLRQYTPLLARTQEHRVTDESGNQRTIAPKPAYFENIAHADPADPNSPLQGVGRLNVETFALHLIGVPIRRFNPAQLLAARWAFDGIFPFVMLMVLSWLTPRSEPRLADQFYAKMKTPIAPTPDADAEDVRKSAENPHRFDNRKLLPGTNWEFEKWTLKDVLGFGGCWAIVGVILLVLWAVLHAGSR